MTTKNRKALIIATLLLLMISSPILGLSAAKTEAKTETGDKSPARAIDKTKTDDSKKSRVHPAVVSTFEGLHDVGLFVVASDREKWHFGMFMGEELVGPGATRDLLDAKVGDVSYGLSLGLFALMKWSEEDHPEQEFELTREVQPGVGLTFRMSK